MAGILRLQRGLELLQPRNQRFDFGMRLACHTLGEQLRPALQFLREHELARLQLLLVRRESTERFAQRRQRIRDLRTIHGRCRDRLAAVRLQHDAQRTQLRRHFRRSIDARVTARHEAHRRHQANPAQGYEPPVHRSSPAAASAFHT